MHRRLFLQASATALILGQLSHRVLSLPGRHLESVGLQLSTLNGPMAQDFEGTLKRVADIGYQQVEFSTFGGLYGRDPAAVRQLLGDLGLSAPFGRLRPPFPANMASLPPAEAMALYRELAGTDRIMANLEAMLPEAKAMAYRSIVLSAVPPDAFQSKAALERLATLFNEAGALCAEHGMTFAYHNHDFDFRPVDGVLPYDYLLQHTDEDQVKFQLDLYWACKADQDPLNYFKQYGHRIHSCHMKDMDSQGDFADVGAGTLDFPGYTRAAVEAGVRYFFVEHDRPQDALVSARSSYQYLASMPF